jgi:hypothetical protein
MYLQVGGRKTSRMNRIINLAGRVLGRLATTCNKFPLLTVLIVSAAIDLIILRSILGLGLFQSADLVVPIYTRQQLSLVAFSAWNYQNFGSTNGTSLFLTFFGAISISTHSPAFAEKFIYFSTPLLSSVSAYLLFKQLRFQPLHAVIFAIGYQFSPWFISEFMSGEPSTVWLYAILPAYLAVLWITIVKPIRVVNFIILSAFCAISIFFTLQSAIVYATFSIPFAFVLFDRCAPRRAATIMAAWLASWLVGLVANLSALFPYFHDLVSVETSSVPFFTYFGFQLAAFQNLRWWLLGIAAVSTVVVSLAWPRLRPYAKPLVGGLLLVQLLFDSIYAIIPTPFAQALFTSVPLLAPFLDFDKFLLVAWGTSFLILATCVGWPMSPAERGSVSKKLAPVRAWDVKSSRSHGIFRDSRAVFRFACTLALVATLVISSLYSDIQPASTEINGANYVASNFQFNTSQVPPGYSQLQSFLLSEGASYSLSYKTILFPQNPGSIIPYYVGRYMIPGFVPPSAPLKNITSMVVADDSMALREMALLGVRYIAVMPSPQNPWWPSLATGPPSVGDLGAIGADGEGWFPQGNETAYLRIFDSWRSLSIAFQSPDLTIFSNPEYVGFAYTYTDYQSVINLTNGNGRAFIDTNPIGGNIVENDNLSGGSDWSFSSAGNASLLPNGTFDVSNNSQGAGAFQSIALPGGSTFSLSFELKLSSLLPGQPAPGNPPTYVTVLWNQDTGSNLTGGTTYVIPPGEDGMFDSLFETPSSQYPIRAEVSVNLQAPTAVPQLFGSYTNVTIMPVNGSDLFSKEVIPANSNESGSDRFTITSLISERHSGYLTINMLYATGWELELPNGSVLEGFSGPFGMLTFVLEAPEDAVLLVYVGQTAYYIEAIASIALLASLCATAVVYAISPVLRMRSSRQVR